MNQLTILVLHMNLVFLCLSGRTIWHQYPLNPVQSILSCVWWAAFAKITCDAITQIMFAATEQFIIEAVCTSFDTCKSRGGPKGVGAMGAIAPPPWHTIFCLFFCHRYEKVKQGPPPNKVDEIRGVFIFGGRLTFINFGLQPPTVEFVPNSAKWA